MGLTPLRMVRELMLSKIVTEVDLLTMGMEVILLMLGMEVMLLKIATEVILLPLGMEEDSMEGNNGGLIRPELSTRNLMKLLVEQAVKKIWKNVLQE